MAGRREEEAIGHYARLMEESEIRVEDPQFFFNYLRMEPAMCDELIWCIEWSQE